ncbi:polysaccharide pyruvyl transferase family protein [Microbacterium sp.]|uniref:polysaccharide pyruvyl transferase family protein n=1 Tax=Microbacterium sp. TaxID=51671 RepID=UPI003A893ED3
MTTADPRPRVLFLGTHGQHNIGDELLLETFLHQLGTDIAYTVNSYDPAFTERQLAGRFDVTVIDTARDRLSLWRRLATTDAVVFGGGSIVKELYATIGRNRYATLLMLLAVVVAARVRRVPIAMLNIGVGPIASTAGRFLAARILRRVQLLTVRDAESGALCARLGVAARVTADAVFGADPALLRGDRLPPRVHGPRVPVALNLNYDIANPDNWEHFQSALAVALDRVNSRQPIEIHALPMQSEGKAHDDAAALAAFAARVPGVPFVMHRPVDHREVAAIVARCDLVIAERFHAIVLAAMLGVPVFALAYDVKVTSLVTALQLGRSAVDINGPLDAGTLGEALFCTLMERRTRRSAMNAAACVLAMRARADAGLARGWLRAVVPLRRAEAAVTP